MHSQTAESRFLYTLHSLAGERISQLPENRPLNALSGGKNRPMKGKTAQ
jgi:hypothetical protein